MKTFTTTLLIALTLAAGACSKKKDDGGGNMASGTAAASGRPSQRNRPRHRQMNRMPRKAMGRAAAGALAIVCG